MYFRTQRTVTENKNSYILNKLFFWFEKKKRKKKKGFFFHQTIDLTHGDFQWKNNNFFMAETRPYSNERCYDWDSIDFACCCWRSWVGGGGGGGVGGGGGDATRTIAPRVPPSFKHGQTARLVVILLVTVAFWRWACRLPSSIDLSWASVSSSVLIYRDHKDC